MQSYYVRDSMLDPMERSLYRALNLVICQRALLFAKINLGDLLATAISGTKSSELGQLAEQRVDFVLCDRDSMRPIAIILLEGTGARVGCADQSDQVAQLCASVGLPLIWLQRQNNYLMQQLTPIIEPLLIDGSVGNDFTNGDRMRESTMTGIAHAMRRGPRHLRKQPAYPGYGALRTIASKLS